MFPHTIYSDPVIINAPQTFVWEILVDLPRYGEWNPFTWRVDTTLRPGDDVDLYVRMPRRGERLQREQVRSVDAPETLAWGMVMGRAWLLNALRTQRLERIDAQRCRYHTWDAFEGGLTPLVVTLFGKPIQDGFNAMALALKHHAELCWRQESATK